MDYSLVSVLRPVMVANEHALSLRSLLLGIDQSRRQLACGLVDTIGSYTFAKTLEYKAKQGLSGNSGREITVIPPAEYRDRFVTAMESYFIACPGKVLDLRRNDITERQM